ncbi:hypothetical protein [Actinopolyspora halophila]|uniref:hypothetical protein n=1 Tax=Actinopolyspora halophila TaxID=1850 RepID=UPI000365C612|nr:hypothetical protein [Actinopolyspora halophila]
MTTQLALGLADRDAGTSAALAAATAGHRDARDRYEAALAALVREAAVFTADDVRREAGHPDDDRPNVLPSVISRAARDGIIREAGEYRSPRRSRHGSRNRLWTAAD